MFANWNSLTKDVNTIWKSNHIFHQTISKFASIMVISIMTESKLMHTSYYYKQYKKMGKRKHREEKKKSFQPMSLFYSAISVSN